MTRILVIDDDNQVRSMLTQRLRSAGYDVEDAPNGLVGIECVRNAQGVRNAPFDVVIADLYMPEKEGLETIMDLRREFPDVKVIAISGGHSFDTGHGLTVAKKLGARYAFEKPVSWDEMLDAVRELS